MKESRLVIKDGKAFLKVVFEKPSVVSEKAVQLWMERLKTMGQAAAVRKCALCGEVVSGEAILEACRRLGVEPRVELVHLLPQEEEKKPEMHESSHLAARLADRESYTMEERREMARALLEALERAGVPHPKKKAAELSGLSQAYISI
jgi:hypothetical protein